MNLIKFIKGISMYIAKTFLKCLTGLTLVPFLALAQNTDDPIVVNNVVLNSGLDDAVTQAFNQAASELSLNSAIPKLGINDIEPVVSSIAINDDKLNIQFDAQKFNDLLAKKGVQVWQGLADPVLTWIYEGESDVSRFDGGNVLSPFAQALSAQADINKYHLMFPILDLEDIRAVNFTSLDNLDKASLVKASLRYGVDYIIAGIVTALPDGSPEFSYMLMDKTGKVLTNSKIAGTPDNVSAQSAQALALALNQNLHVNSEQNTIENSVNNAEDRLGAFNDFVRVRVENLGNLNDLASFADQLSQIGIEGTLNYQSINDDGVVIDINTEVKAELLDSSLEHSGNFVKLEPYVYRYTKRGARLNPQSNALWPADNMRPDTRIFH